MYRIWAGMAFPGAHVESGTGDIQRESGEKSQDSPLTEEAESHVNVTILDCKALDRV